MTSAVTPPQGNASPTQSNRPVRATEASTVSVSSGLTRAQIDHFDLHAFGAEFLRDRERFVHHRAVGHDAEIAARPNDSRFADRQRSFGRASALRW